MPWFTLHGEKDLSKEDQTMSNSAMIMMVVSQVVITGLTLFFFVKVLKGSNNKNEDSDE